MQGLRLPYLPEYAERSRQRCAERGARRMDRTRSHEKPERLDRSTKGVSGEDHFAFAGIPIGAGRHGEGTFAYAQTRRVHSVSTPNGGSTLSGGLTQFFVLDWRVHTSSGIHARLFDPFLCRLTVPDGAPTITPGRRRAFDAGYDTISTATKGALTRTQPAVPTTAILTFASRIYPSVGSGVCPGHQSTLR